jgi:hypothetical protein
MQMPHSQQVRSMATQKSLIAGVLGLIFGLIGFTVWRCSQADPEQQAAIDEDVPESEDGVVDTKL